MQDFISNLQLSFNEVSKLPIAIAVIHFIFSHITAGLSFQVYIKLVSSTDDLTARLAAIRKVKSEFGLDYYSFIFLYSFLTGIITAAFISIQFEHTLNIPYSILYGAGGPFLVRQKLIKFISEPTDRLQASVVSSYKGVVESIEEEKNKAVEKSVEEIQSTLSDIMKDVYDDDGEINRSEESQ